MIFNAAAIQSAQSNKKGQVKGANREIQRIKGSEHLKIYFPVMMRW